jgi:hypothetical protein
LDPDSASDAPSEAAGDDGGDWARARLLPDVDLPLVDLEAEAEAEDEDLVVVCLALPFVLEADVEGPAVDEARLGGLKGSRRFFCAGSPAILWWYWEWEREECSVGPKRAVNAGRG